MTYYPVFVEKEEWSESGRMLYDERLVQICSTEEDAIKWIKETDAITIVGLAASIDPTLMTMVVRDVDEDSFNDRSKSREFFTEEFYYGAKDDTKTNRYGIYTKRFDNKIGRY